MTKGAEVIDVGNDLLLRRANLGWAGCPWVARLGFSLRYFSGRFCNMSFALALCLGQGLAGVVLSAVS